jgi:Icc-related predicted phosphoesterase
MKNATPMNESSALLKDTDTSAATQRNQIIALINKHQSANTPELRSYGMMSPATRIFELRQQGYRIEKVLERYTDEAGKTHNGVARYYFAHNPPANDPNSEVAA